jgi:cytochrome c
MASLETNKLLAAVLTAGIIASGAGVISRILYHPVTPEEPAYQVEVPEAEGEGEGAPQEQPLPLLLADASAEEGEGEARACAACHSFEQGGAAKVGPPLWGVVGRPIGSEGGFSYSEALAGKGGEWTYENLSHFLTNPKEWAPGTKMAFAGIDDSQDRANVILYLRSLSDSPPPLPEVDEQMRAQAEGGGEQAAAEGGAGFAALVAEADPADGESAARPCVACHSFEAGGAVKIGPPLHDVVGRPIGSVEGFSYSEALAGKGGEWTYDNLNHFLTNPREWAQGTKMAFAGVKDEEDRAAIVSYLRSITENPPPLPEAGGSKETKAGDAGGGGQPAPAEGEGGGSQQAAAQDGAEAAGGGGDGFAALVAAGDAAAGERSARVCVACHSFEAGGPTRIGPPLHDVVGRAIGSVEGFSYSSGLAEKEGEWTYDNLDHFLANPREWAPGTKMAFVGVRKEEDRANIVAYLRSITESPPPLPGGG